MSRSEKGEAAHKGYLTLPVISPACITEGWRYTHWESKRHGVHDHKAIDFEAQYGASVRAAAAGYAVAFYHRFVVRNPNGTIRLFEGKPIGNGFGYAVQIWHPEQVCGVTDGMITQYGHLSSIHPQLEVKRTAASHEDLAASIVRRNARLRSNNRSKMTEEQLDLALKQTAEIVRQYPWVDKWYGFQTTGEPEELESYLWNETELAEFAKAGSPYVKWVEQGEEIGRVGASAIIWGDLTYNEEELRPDLAEPDPTELWDEIHLHFEVARRSEARSKHGQVDPFGIYRSARNYTDQRIHDLSTESWFRGLDDIQFEPPHLF